MLITIKINLVFFDVPEIVNSDRDKEEISKILREIEVEDTDINVVWRKIFLVRY